MKKLGSILLIDDSDTDNFIHERRLNKLGVTDRIVVRKNGREGLDYLHGLTENAASEERPDLLFLDINMPVMDGWQFLDAYQRLPEERRATATIVMLTSSVGDLDYERAGTYPVIDEHVSKPLTKEKIEGLMGRYFPD